MTTVITTIERTVWSCNAFTGLGLIHHSRSFRLQQQKISFQRRFLNRFLFDPDEVHVEDDDERDESDVDGTSSHDRTYFVVLPKDDYRTIHASKILGLHNGDAIRAGVVKHHYPNPWKEPQQPKMSLEHRETTTTTTMTTACDHSNRISGHLTDNAIIQWIPEGKVKKAEPLGNGNPPGSLKIQLHDLIPAAHDPTNERNNEEQTNQAQKDSKSSTSSSYLSSVSLLLALPRPLQLGRMLPMIAQMGVQDIILTGAQKVPKDYFGSHLFRHPDAMKERLIEGLCQAGDVHLPTVRVVKNLKHFCTDDLDELFPLDEYARVITHPERRQQHTNTTESDNNNEKDNDEDEFVLRVARRMRDVTFPSSSSPSSLSNPRRILLAVGPEGGWEEPSELDMLIGKHHFQHVTMGTRVLRSDCAVISLLALAHDAVNDN